MKLSIVVISYNMNRELPRTIQTLSPNMQHGISPDDYEIIIVDNGSQTPIPETACRKWFPNLKLYHMKNPTVSPAPAINYGIERAGGELIGVFIDGARMASPGMLSQAILASKAFKQPAIATLSFHLGPKVQMLSIKDGYNQQIEDELLKQCCWEENGYNLFNISVLAGSSDGGYFIPPRETNALFLKARHWQTLGGFDVNFVTPGGGFVNYDMWNRICNDSNFDVIMLLGEGTFHQVHGGIATNTQNPPRSEFVSEYFQIRGCHSERPNRSIYSFGLPTSESLRWIKLSTAMSKGEDPYGTILPLLINKKFHGDLQKMSARKPKISIVVVLYNMQREAPRTLHSLSPSYQIDIQPDEYEVLIYENGSQKKLSQEQINALPQNFHYTYIENAHPSPVFAINRGLREARGELIGVMIDGARIITPGLLARALEASKTQFNTIIGTMGWYLGYDQQAYALENGYTKEIEDDLLNNINWPKEPYRLFEIAVPDQSSVDGWFCSIAESNTLFMNRNLWKELNGYDDRFDSPGGGLANIDILCRACKVPNIQFIMLIDEASFHQSHGGTATNSPRKIFEQNILIWKKQYENIRGHEFYFNPPPNVNRFLYGRIRPEMATAFARSLISPNRLHSGCSTENSLMGPLPFNNTLWCNNKQLKYQKFPSYMPSELSEVIKLAQDMFINHRLLETRDICRMAVKKYPHCEEIFRLLRICANVGSMSDRNPPDRYAGYFYELGKACLLLGDVEGAKNNWYQALLHDPTQDHVRTELSNLELPGGNYYNILNHLHNILCPKLYLEIGIHQGRSLGATQPSTKIIGIDPKPDIKIDIKADTTIFSITSDTFFESSYPSETLANGVDLAFIDGHHEFKQVIRDFWNVEKYCNQNSMIILHDVIPLDEYSASKIRNSTWWTGDVWKIIPFLYTIRPDLEICIIRVAPSGLALIRNLNPNFNLSIIDFEKHGENFDKLKVKNFHEEILPKIQQLPNDVNKITTYLNKYSEKSRVNATYA